MANLRPPLPPPLSHEGITFVAGGAPGSEIPDTVLAEIARALGAALPAGDFEVSPSGLLIYAESESPSQWRATGRVESVERGLR